MSKSKQVKLKQLVSPVSRPVKVSANEVYTCLGVKWYANGLFAKEPLSGKDIKASRLFKIESGDFIYNRLFAWKGSFAIAGSEHNECFVSGEFPMFRVDESKLLSAYLMRYFSSPIVWDAIAKQSSGASQTSRLRFHENEFLDWEIPLPSLLEQQRLVRILDEAGALRQLRARADARTNDLIPALFNEMFGDPLNNPLHWQAVEIDNFATDIQPGFAQRPRPDGKGVLQIRPLNLTQDGTIITEGTKSVPCSPQQFFKYQLKMMDVIFNNTNSPELVGKTALFELSGDYVLSNHMTRIRVDDSRVHPLYIQQALHTIWRLGYFKEHCTQWINQAAFNKDQMSSLRVPLPPLALQREFAARVAEVRALQAQQARSRQRLEDLFQALLHRAFAGEL